MTRIAVSRRKALESGACALAGAAGFTVTASARAGTRSGTPNEEIVRKWYKAWEGKDWGQLEILLADNFTFTSPVDAHISTSAEVSLPHKEQQVIPER